MEHNSWVFREAALESTSDAPRVTEDVGHRVIFSLNYMVPGNNLFRALRKTGGVMLQVWQASPVVTMVMDLKHY